MQDETPPKPHVPAPPSKEDVDQVSREQGLITDEWADAEPGAPPAADKT